MFKFFIIVSIVAGAVAFRTPSAFMKPTVVKSQQSLKMSAEFQSVSSLLNAVVEAKPDDYVYGAVAAPPFVLPLAALLVIATAAIPILLSPGEKALDQQRENERITMNEFGKDRKKGDL